MPILKATENHFWWQWKKLPPHSRLLRADPNAPEIAAVHPFRFFEGDQIIEE